MVEPHPLSNEELDRFIDGELPEYRRTEIEAMLAANPGIAARVMADLHVMDALRADQPRRFAPPADSVAAARRIERKLRLRRLTSMLRRGTAAASVVLIGFGAHSAGLLGLSQGTALDDSFVNGVREARDIARLDSGAAAAPESAVTKIERLETAIDVVVPDLPPSWELRDVSVQSLDGAQSVVVTAQTDTLGDLTLVATPAGETEVVPPTTAEEGPVATVVWQSRGTAYALVGAAAPARLITIANGIEAEIW
jgi:anti-sigma factor RsiW